MATSATILTLHQLNDAALMGPELGTVNFRLLHTTIQIIVDQLGLADLKIEFKGNESQIIQKMYDPLRRSAATTATQYEITSDLDGAFSGGGRRSTGGGPGFANAGGAYAAGGTQGAYSAGSTGGAQSARGFGGPQSGGSFVSPRGVGNVTSNDIGGTIRSSRSGISKAPNIDKGHSQTVVIVPTNAQNEITPAFTVAMTTDTFEKLTRDVNDLKDKYTELTKMSSNAELMKAVRGSNVDVQGPIVDMYKIISLSKRIEAAEAGVTKLASIIEDVVKAEDGGDKQQILQNVAQATQILKTPQRKISEGPTGGPGVGESTSAVSGENQVAVGVEGTTDVGRPTSGGHIGGKGDLKKRIEMLEKRVDELQGTGKGTHLPRVREIKGAVAGLTFSEVDLAKMDVKETLVLIQDEFRNIRQLIETLDVPSLQNKIEEMASGVITTSVAGPTTPGEARKSVASSVGGGDISEQMVKMEQQQQQYKEQLHSLDVAFHTRIEMMAEQVASMERELGIVTERMLLSPSTGDAATELFRKMTQIENLTNQIGKSTAELMDERHERQLHMAAIKEQVELLKTVKADKYEMENILADKVDIGTVNRKVSHEQFNATCTDLTRGIEDALGKLTKQEELWQQTLNEIQTEIGSKLDKIELGPLKDFVTQKLKVLQAKFKALSKLKKEHEAAGTKAALLKDVKCISCDQDVVMRKQVDANLYPQAPVLAPVKTMAPYLAYELDKLRKQQQQLNSRNLIHFETIKKGDICNRYCGGSHTTTTPQQRVTRMGNFLEQWGPDVSNVNESEVKGSDGMFYKGEEKNASVEMPKKPKPPIFVQGDIVSNRPGNLESINELSDKSDLLEKKSSRSSRSTAVSFE